jgi:hypothetical protein
VEAAETQKTLWRIGDMERTAAQALLAGTDILYPAPMLYMQTALLTFAGLASLRLVRSHIMEKLTANRLSTKF